MTFTMRVVVGAPVYGVVDGAAVVGAAVVVVVVVVIRGSHVG